MNLPVEPAAECGVSTEEIAILAAVGVERELPEGGQVFAVGAPGDSMFVVLAGQIELRLGGGERRKQLGPGCFFGELALLGTAHSRSGSAWASPGTRVLEITRQAFDALIARAPALAVALVARGARTLLAAERELSQRLAKRNRELEQALDFLRRTREELSVAEVAAITDPLTGVYNRRGLERLAPRLLTQAQRAGVALALVLLDLDDFKGINDRFGHATGDAVLCAVAARLRAAVRWSDLPCRLGGDEFVALLGDISSAAVGRERAAAVHGAVQAGAVEAAGRRVALACSAGAVLSRPGEALDALVARADHALYAAKGRGRGVVVWEG